jgi:hypothetical protein
MKLTDTYPIGVTVVIAELFPNDISLWGAMFIMEGEVMHYEGDKLLVADDEECPMLFRAAVFADDGAWLPPHDAKVGEEMAFPLTYALANGYLRVNN